MIHNFYVQLTASELLINETLLIQQYLQDINMDGSLFSRTYMCSTANVTWKYFK